jgi:DMSO reductase anchor subunit
MNVAPFHPDPRILDLFAFFFITAGALAVGLVLRKALDRFLPEDDPRRQLIAQAMLYGGMFVVIALSVWLRHRE